MGIRWPTTSRVRFRRQLLPRPGKVIDLVIDKMPVSISLGLWTDADLGLSDLHPAWASPRRFATAAGSTSWTSGVIILGYAIPSFLFAVLLLVLFAGGSYLGLVSP